jgi:hypothetical protein
MVSTVNSGDARLLGQSLSQLSAIPASPLIRVLRVIREQIRPCAVFGNGVGGLIIQASGLDAPDASDAIQRRLS